MKVKLTGINYQDTIHKIVNRKWYGLLHQLSFPVEVEVDSDNMICLKSYIKDPDSPNSEEEWDLIWFTYEEIKE